MATETPPARIFDETMTLEWIVLTEDLPNVEAKRAQIRPYAHHVTRRFFLSIFYLSQLEADVYIRSLHVAHMMPRIGPENAIYNMGGTFSIPS
jgi:hypothetical protein